MKAGTAAHSDSGVSGREQGTMLEEMGVAIPEGAARPLGIFGNAGVVVVASILVASGSARSRRTLDLLRIYLGNAHCAKPPSPGSIHCPSL